MKALITLSLSLACPVVAAAASPIAAREVELAIESGRLEQARLMIAEMIKAGEPAEALDKVLAYLAFASGKYEEALARYQTSIGNHPADRMACERGGIAALHVNRLADARSLLACATADRSATWRAWNARGVLADIDQDWGAAKRFYGEALALDRDNARILNNVGYSNLLQGDWDNAVRLFERAQALDPSIERIANNLELAGAALDEDLPRRRPAESASAWAARLNDAGVAAELLGDRQRAIANFTRALEASGSWYDRAANNLAAVGSK
ncbi:MAG: tetratricopeptide repeat protein [Sphingomicrobium sp.]